MKRCPKCGSVFADSNRFCDLDGTLLVADHRSPGNADRTKDPEPGQNWKILAIGAVAGLAIGVAIFVVYYGLTRQKHPDNSNASSNAIIGPIAPQVASPAEAVPSATLSPNASPSPSPSPSPSAVLSPSPQPSPSVTLSSSPISTSAAARANGQTVIIRLTNGSSIQAEEAWTGPEGIWYRRGGIVALLDPVQVKAIERSPLPTSSPTLQP